MCAAAVYDADVRSILRSLPAHLTTILKDAFGIPCRNVFDSVPVSVEVFDSALQESGVEIICQSDCTTVGRGWWQPGQSHLCAVITADPADSEQNTLAIACHMSV